MNEDLARFAATIAFKSASDISRLLPILKGELSSEEYEPLRQAITLVSQTIATDILQKIFDKHPNIDASFKKTIEQYGRLP